MGVGDIFAVHDWSRYKGNATHCHDCRHARRQHDADMVGRCWGCQPGATAEPSRHGVDVSDSSWGQAWSGDLHQHGSARPHGMRGNRVGVGDSNTLPDRAWVTGHAEGGDDGG